jgi:hypothetical protein
MTGLELLLLKLLLGGAATVAARLTYAQIRAWLDARLVQPQTVARLLKTRLESGDYSVVAHVFMTHAPSTVLASKTWTGKTLDPALEARFAGRTELIVEAS